MFTVLQPLTITKLMYYKIYWLLYFVKQLLKIKVLLVKDDSVLKEYFMALIETIPECCPVQQTQLCAMKLHGLWKFFIHNN